MFCVANCLHLHFVLLDRPNDWTGSLVFWTSQVTGWENRLQNDLQRVKWDVKPYSTAHL